MSMLTKFRPLFADPFFARSEAPIDRLWRKFLDWEAGNEVGFTPPMNFIEKPDRYIVTAELPGVDKGDIHVTLSDNVLSFRGEKKEVKKEEKDDFRCYETTFGTFERSLTLPLAADDQDVDAKLEHGILTITVLKKKEARRKEIQIKAK